MFPYILLIVVALLFSFVAKKSTTGKWVLGNSNYIKANNMSLFMFFLTLFFILALRDVSIGRDVSTYQFLFEEYSHMSFGKLRELDGDYIYILLNWIVGKATDNYQIFLALVAAMTVYPIYEQYNNDKRHSFMKVVLFMNMTVFIMIFSGLRQSLAIAVGMIAYKYVKEKKLALFLLMVVLAIGFHHSAFILLFMYPIYHMRFKRVHLVVIVPITFAIYVFNKEIFGYLVNVFDRLSGGRYEATVTSTGAFTMIFLLGAFLAFSYLVPDERKMDTETYGLRNYLMLSLWLQCFAPVHSLAMRFNYYYIIFVPMVLPKILEVTKGRYKKIAKLAEIIITLYLLYYYLKHMYRGCVTGISGLDTYPYIPFWKN